MTLVRRVVVAIVSLSVLMVAGTGWTFAPTPPQPAVPVGVGVCLLDGPCCTEVP